MPGNEVGDRVRNFFGQENLSQGQYHSQAVDGNWPGLSNNLWAGSQRPTGAPFISNLKNFNLQQSDFEQGHTSTPHLRHGLNLAQSNLRPDSGRNQLPNQQTTVNGYMQGHHVFQSRQNEANILGMDTETDLHGISNLSRGISVLDSQQGAGLEHYKKNLTRTDASESPVNYDFFGSQQQMSGRHSGMLQSFPRQQSGMNDMQLLQQQAMLNQMQELQRQQQFHQLEARQQSSMNSASSISKQTIASHSASLINGIPINEASNLEWQQPEVMATNANWLQHGASAVMQGSSNGLVLSPEQLRLMGLVPNQGEQSLYGLPISGSRGTPNLYSHVQADKPAVSQVSIQHQHQFPRIPSDKPTLPHISASGHSFSVHQYTSISDQTNTNDGTSISRQDIQGKGMFGSLAQGINSGLNMENLQQVNSEQRDAPIEDFNGRQDLAGSSDTSQDKVVVQVPPSQNVATLDPTEEKILFGSDDSLWDGLSWSAGFNMLDGTDSFGGVPSVQSGSWSALMQSAVAETSSSEMGIQEEWSGLSFRNTERSSGSERPSTMDSTKQQSGWVADNNLQSAPNITSRPFLRPDDLSKPSTTVNYSGLPGFHQSGADTAQEQQDRLQIDSSQRSIPQFLERGKWLDCSPQQKPIAEGSHGYGNAANTSGLEVNEKVISGSWTHQQTLSSPNSLGEPFNRSNGWNAIKSPTPSNNSNMKIRENENVLQPHHDKAMQEDMGQVPAIWEPDSDTNSSVGLEHAKSPGNMQVCGEDSGMNGIAAAIPNTGATWVSRQSSQQLPNVDVWRHTDTVGSYKRNEGAGKYRHHMDKNPLVLESLKNEKSEGEAHDMENSYKKDKSADGLASDSSHHRTGGLRENTNFDGDLHSPKLSGQGNRRPPVTRKFQYHPMGDVGVDIEPYGNKHVINSQPMPHQPIGGLKGQDQSYPGQSKYSHSDGNYNGTEKGDSKTIDDNASKSMLPGHMPKTLTSFDRGVGNYVLSTTASPSQNILELLHKVDQSREHGIATNTSTSNHPLSSRVMDAESSDGSAVHPQRNHNSLSQGFALQLAPPTQRLPMATSHATTHVASETGDKGHTWLAATQTFPSRESPHELRNNISGSSGQIFDKASQYSALGNIPQAFTSGFPFSRIHTQNQNVANLGGQVANTQCDNATFVDQTASTNQVDEYCERAQTGQSELQSAQSMSQIDSMSQIRAGDPTMKISALETGTAPHPSVTSSQQSAPSKVPHNVWTSVSSKQHPNALKIPSHPQPIIICETTTGPQKPGIEDSEKGHLSEQRVLPESVDAVEETASASQVKELVKYTSDASQSSPAATSKDIEDFGRSLRPNNFLHHNFSMLNQVHSMKHMEIDPSNRDVKRFKVSDNVMDKQQVDSISNHGPQTYGYNNIVKDVSDNSSSVPPSDPNLLSFSTKPGDARDASPSSQEVVGYGQRNALNVANNNKVASVRSEHSVINPQMAPSWFEQYGAFKNGKMLQMYDVRTMTPQKVMEQPLIIRNQSGSLHLANSMEQVNSLNDAGQNPLLTSVASEHLPSQLLLPPVVEPDLSSMRPKKRKSSTSELIPWHKQLSQGSERLQDISVAELDWAQAANRLVEKVEDDAELVEDLPMMKPKRRLVLTTQLMQQLLDPPSAAVLSADVKVHHESVVYSVARLVLGDACSSVSWSGSDTLVSPGSKDLLPDKLKASEKIDQYSLKVEDFVGRARKLENDILRLDSRASVLDVRVECQDLERFSVINRFAKFHGRGQNDGAETSSSDAAANALKSCPQKYVTAVPMPRNLPDRVQCLSL